MVHRGSLVKISMRKKKEKKKKKKRGFTILEVVVALAIFALVSGSIVEVYLRSIRQNNSLSGQLSGESEARTLVQNFVNEVRGAQYSSLGTYPLSKASDNEVDFYTNLDGDPAVEQVRYFFVGNILKKGVLKPSGNPLTYVPGNEVVTEVLHYVTTTAPIFTYYNSGNANQALGQPVALGQVRVVGIYIRIDKNPNVGPVAFSTQTKTEIRSLENVALSTASTTIAVSPTTTPAVPVTSMTMTPLTVSLQTNAAPYKFVTTINPPNASNTSVLWAVISGDGTIDSDGTFHAPAMPQYPVVVRAKTNDGSNITVTSSVTITPGTLQLRSTTTGDLKLRFPYTLFGNSDFAYVGSYTDGDSLTIWQLKSPGSPTAPVLAYYYTNTSFCDKSMVTTGTQYVYVADYCASPYDSIDVFDVGNISNPTKASRVSSLTLPGKNGAIYSLDIQGNYIYAVDLYDNYFSTISINPNDPTNLTLVTSIPILPGSGSTKVLVSGDYAFVTYDVPSTFSVINIHDPAHPTLVTSITDTTRLNSGRFAIKGKYAYLPSKGGCGMTVVDISNPPSINLSSIKSFITDPAMCSAFSLSIYANYAYIAGDEFIIVVDISDPLNPKIFNPDHTFIGLFQDTKIGKADVYANNKYIYNISLYGATYPEEVANPGNFNVFSW